ncbi:D-alanyl-D-alanine carboxypeptidase precursor [Streptomyces sp. YIM 121038]|uniref:serine hydrolase domain-containing protein n=1 Tax=Streptomyces sp. YIM 121038 TaxID=2136401 RepID=UPI001110EFCE|nr:serine hydrolase domain-containing protein [Streptomyces sp. YIM 121038]QCX81605.1 D-alanyl-D-alanine carboxypeptidase precursor [Streptomyces sp. YIM 121038]
MTGTGPTMSRRTTMAAAAGALLAGAAPQAAAAPHDTAPTAPGRGRHALQADVDAVRATGATGVIAEVQTPHGRTTARAGVADLESGRPVPWDAYYRIGSDTKTFTAVVALQLVGEGRLALTDTVERWLPGAVRGNGNDGGRITVANLLRQTSGLNDYVTIAEGEFTPEGYRKGRFRTHTPREQLAAALAKPPQWLPRRDAPAAERRWGYANTNYVVAGLVIEAVTGRPWAQEVHERIIEPLGLRHTLIPGTSPYVPQPTATAYTQFPGSKELTDTTLAAVGGADGALISTTRDHAVFLRALMAGRLLRPAQLAAMRRTVPAEDWIRAKGVRYGLGIAWRPVAGSGSGLWFHGGTHLGVVSESGVTEDGTRAVTTATFTLRTDGTRQEAQDAATRRLVDNALRAGGAR